MATGIDSRVGEGAPSLGYKLRGGEICLVPSVIIYFFCFDNKICKLLNVKTKRAIRTFDHERFVLSSAGWRSGKRDVAIGAGGVGFDPRAGQIEHSIANSSTLLRRYCGVRCCVAQAISRGDRPPATRYLLRRNNARIKKI